MPVTKFEAGKRYTWTAEDGTAINFTAHAIADDGRAAYEIEDALPWLLEMPGTFEEVEVKP